MLARVFFVCLFCLCFLLFWSNFESGTLCGTQKHKYKKLQLLTQSCLQSRAERHSSKLRITVLCDTIQYEYYHVPDSVLHALYVILLNSFQFNYYPYFTDKDAELPRDYPYRAKGQEQCSHWQLRILYSAKISSKTK